MGDQSVDERTVEGLWRSLRQQFDDEDLVNETVTRFLEESQRQEIAEPLRWCRKWAWGLRHHQRRSAQAELSYEDVLAPEDDAGRRVPMRRLYRERVARTVVSARDPAEVVEVWDELAKSVPNLAHHLAQGYERHSRDPEHKMPQKLRDRIRRNMRLLERGKRVILAVLMWLQVATPALAYRLMVDVIAWGPWELICDAGVCPTGIQEVSQAEELLKC